MCVCVLVGCVIGIFLHCNVILLLPSALSLAKVKITSVTDKSVGAHKAVADNRSISQRSELKCVCIFVVKLII